MDNKDNKHLIWGITLMLITLILCGTFIWINYHPFSFRLEMDDNTLEAVKSIDWKSISTQNNCIDEHYWYNGGKGRSFEDTDFSKLNSTIYCLKNRIK